MASNYADVANFHAKFGLLPEEKLPHTLNRELLEFRIKFMQEELDEYRQAMGFEYHQIDGWIQNRPPDLAKAFDALLDLVVVAMGTSVLHSFPWQAGWDSVHRANMAKVRAQRAEDSKRGTAYDVIKPEGWEPPRIEWVLEEYKRWMIEHGHDNPISRIDRYGEGEYSSAP